MERVLDAINTGKSKADGTYSFISGESITYATGYQVSFVRPEAFEQLTVQNWDDITNYFCQELCSIAHIGVYCGSAEVSFHCNSFSEAVSVMEDYNQESILNWEKKEIMPDSIEDWFIFNKNYDENKVIDYGKILREIQQNCSTI